MLQNVQKEEMPVYEQSGLTCPQCNTNLPKTLFIRYIKASFIRYFLFTFCLSFTLMTIIVDLNSHYNSSNEAKISSINPYQIALIFSGAISLIGWLSQKQNDLRKELLQKEASKSNVQP